MLVINLLQDDGGGGLPKEKHHTIEVPEVSHDEAQNASDLVTLIQEKYDIHDDDVDQLFNAMVTVFLRGKQLNKN